MGNNEAEAKLTEKEPSAALKKFQQMLNIPAVQLTNEGVTFRLFSNGPNKIPVGACIPVAFFAAITDQKGLWSK